MQVKPINKQVLAMLESHLGHPKKNNSRSTGKKKAKKIGSGKMVPPRNDPAWYLRKGAAAGMVNFRVPDQSIPGLYRQGNYGRLDFMPSVQNVIPAGQVWDASMSEIMAKLRAAAGATQLYTVQDLKLYFLQVREVFSMAVALSRVAQGFNASSPTDTAASTRFAAIAGVPNAASLTGWRRNLGVIRSQLMTDLNIILPYVPKGLPWFDRAAHLFGNFFKDAPTAKGSVFCPKYVPTWFALVEEETTGVAPATGVVPDIQYRGLSNNGTRCTGTALYGGLSTDLGLTAGDIIGIPMEGIYHGFGASAGEGPGYQDIFAFSNMSGSDVIAGLEILDHYMQMIVSNDTFGLIRGDLSRAFPMWDASASAQALVLKPSIIYDRLTSLQFHNASSAGVPNLQTGAADTNDHLEPGVGVVSRDVLGGPVMVAPKFYVRNNAMSSLGAYVHLRGAWDSSRKLISWTSSVLAELYGFIQDGVSPDIADPQSTQVIDTDKDEMSAGEVLEVTRFKHTLAAPLTFTSTGVTGGRAITSPLAYDCTGTDVYLGTAVLINCSGEKFVVRDVNTRTVPNYSGLLARWTLGPISWMAVGSYIDMDGVTQSVASMRLQGDTYNLTPVGPDVLRTLLNTGTQSVLTL